MKDRLHPKTGERLRFDGASYRRTVWYVNDKGRRVPASWESWVAWPLAPDEPV